jgi:hypothetical protein
MKCAPQYRLQRHDPFAGWVIVRRAGIADADALAVLWAHCAAHPENTYRLATLDGRGAWVGVDLVAAAQACADRVQVVSGGTA